MIVCSDDKLTTFPANQCPQMLMSSCTNLSINSTSGITINHQPPSHPHEALKCPRCDSSNTKFCYYNNYSLSQPRHFCKSCKRYWTRGGSLRNVPVGGSSRKNKRIKRCPPPPPPNPPPPPPPSLPLPNPFIFTHEYHHLSDHDHLSTNFGHSFGLDHCIEDYNRPLPPLDYPEAADNPWHFIPFDNNTDSVVLRSATPGTVYWNL